MSPTTSFIQNDKFPNTCLRSTNTIIRGPRPSPLNIQKSSSSSHPRPQQQKRYQTSHKSNKPVIIYLESPKIIHTRPQDFMALVQSLTGLSPTKELQRSSLDDDRSISSSEYGSASDDSRNADSCKMLGSSSMDLNLPNKFNDIPLYTPTGLDFFHS